MLHRPPNHGLAFVAALGLVPACSGASATLEPQPAPAIEAVPEERPLGPAASAPRDGSQIDGSHFPDKVLALTWDDGPDANTLALASYLAREHVAATFFVVREWSGGLSSDPGFGGDPFQTGFAYLPVLGDLVALGHRLGNHTLNHVLLGDARPDLLIEEIRANQDAIDPFLTNGLRLFRAPGGDWNARDGRLLLAEESLADLVGPVRWDVDRKDWESSVTCGSDAPLSECEPNPRGRERRVKPAVVARRYLASIARAGHGVVLFHDRVGDVGSDYALEVAKDVIPALVAEGYVFAAPVLRFGAAASRLAAPSSGPSAQGPARLGLKDLDGDGRADVCVDGPSDRRCARSIPLPGTADDRRPRTVFEASPATPPGWGSEALPGEDRVLYDLDGDGRADLCVERGGALLCALSTGTSFGPLEVWSRDGDLLPRASFGDLNGDGRVDLCAPRAGEILCALSTGRSFTLASAWLSSSSGGDDARLARSTSLALGDVNGDGRADLCGYDAGEVLCALAP